MVCSSQWRLCLFLVLAEFAVELCMVLIIVYCHSSVLSFDIGGIGTHMSDQYNMDGVH